MTTTVFTPIHPCSPLFTTIHPYWSLLTTINNHYWPTLMTTPSPTACGARPGVGLPQPWHSGRGRHFCAGAVPGSPGRRWRRLVERCVWPWLRLATGDVTFHNHLQLSMAVELSTVKLVSFFVVWQLRLVQGTVAVELSRISDGRSVMVNDGCEWRVAFWSIYQPRFDIVSQFIMVN